MHYAALCVLAAQSLLFSLPVRAQIITTTLTWTTTVLTSTTTLTLDASLYASVTTETTAVPVSASPFSSATLVAGDLSHTTSSAAAATSATAGAMGYTGAAFASAVLNSTNYYRAHHQAANLTWDATLASYAQNYAEKCLWQHSGGPYGENLAAGYPTPALSIDAWADEEAKYDYAHPKFSESTGHFTQLVWQNTTSVGCGAVDCNSSSLQGWYLVCEYAPAGNVAGEYRAQVRKGGEGNDGKLGIGSGAAGRTMGTGGALGVLAALYVGVLALSVV